MKELQRTDFSKLRRAYSTALKNLLLLTYIGAQLGIIAMDSHIAGYLCRFGSEPIIRFWNLWRDLTRKLQDLAYTTFNATLWCTLHGRDRFWTYSGACSSDWGGNYQVFQVSRIGVPSIVGGQSIEELCFKMITQGCEYCDFHSWLFDWYGMMWSVRATIWFLMRQIR